MSIFNFLKPKKDPLADVLQKVNEKPALRRYMLDMMAEEYAKHLHNLQAVGRDSDAVAVSAKFLKNISNAKTEDIQSAIILNLLTHAAIHSGAFQVAKEILKAVLNVNQDHSTLDLTVAYFNLGLIYHQIRTDPEKELWAYHSATEAIAPVACEEPASTYNKAKAHFFAYMCASRIGNHEHEKWHDYKRRELAPDANWEDPSSVKEWLRQAP